MDVEQIIPSTVALDLSLLHVCVCMLNTFTHTHSRAHIHILTHIHVKSNGDVSTSYKACDRSMFRGVPSCYIDRNLL